MTDSCRVDAKHFLRGMILRLFSQDIVDDKRSENCSCKLEKNVDIIISDRNCGNFNRLRLQVFLFEVKNK